MTKTEKADRRKRAVTLVREGQSQITIARVLGVSQGAVCQWVKAAEQKGGLRNLNAKPQGHRQPKLTDTQKKQLVQALLKGPKAFGYENDLWTGHRVAQLIQDQFGQTYHHEYVPKLLHALGFSVQLPQKRFREQDQKAIRDWVQNQLPAIKKSSRKAVSDSLA
jgi:transposase